MVGVAVQTSFQLQVHCIGLDATSLIYLCYLCVFAFHDQCECILMNEISNFKSEMSSMRAWCAAGGPFHHIVQFSSILRVLGSRSGVISMGR